MPRSLASYVVQSHAIAMREDVVSEDELAELKDCTRLIDHFGRRGRWQQALHVLRDMPALALRPNVVTCTAAIAACGRGQQWESAVNVLASMQARGPAPTTATYANAVSMAGRGFHWELALALAEECSHAHGIPDATLCSSLASALGRSTLWEGSLHVLVEARAKSILPDRILCGAVARACEKAGRWELALSVSMGAPQLRGDAPQRRVAKVPTESRRPGSSQLPPLVSHSEVQGADGHSVSGSPAHAAQGAGALGLGPEGDAVGDALWTYVDGLAARGLEPDWRTVRLLISEGELQGVACRQAALLQSVAAVKGCRVEGSSRPCALGRAAESAAVLALLAAGRAEVAAARIYTHLEVWRPMQRRRLRSVPSLLAVSARARQAWRWLGRRRHATPIALTLALARRRRV